MSKINNKIINNFVALNVPLSCWTNIALLCGIWFGYTHTWLVVLPLLFLSPIFYICSYTQNLKKSVAYITLFFLLGIGAYMYKAQRATAFYKIKGIRLYARVIDINFLEGRKFQYKTLLEVKKFKYKDTWFKNNFMLNVYTQEEPMCSVDSHISCGTFTLTPPKNKDFQLYLHKENVSGSLFLKKLYFTHLEVPEFSVKNWLYQQKKELWEKLSLKIPPTTFAFFSSLFMGNKGSVDAKLEPHKSSFKTWGISHCLSRSGMHLIIFILIWNLLLNFLPISFISKHVLLSGLLTTYCLLTWTSIPFMRAVNIYCLYKIALFMGLQHHSLNILCTVCTLTLLYNPFYVFALDFQLSFLLSFCLIWIAHVTHQRKIFLFQSVALPL